MGYIPDLQQAGPVKSVGYLSREHDFPKGETSDAAFDRLANLALLHILNWLGYHECDLDPCGWNRPQPELYWRGMRIPHRCSSDILVPHETVVYMAPAMILHYICVHHYLPPTCFLDAVIKCPEPRSEQYRASIKTIAPRLGDLLG